MEWHAMGIKEVEGSLNSDISKGLGSDDAAGRLSTYGVNKIAEEKKLSFFTVALKEIREPMILLLFVVGIVYSFWGKLEDAVTIFIIISFLVFVEVFIEFRAKKSIAALKKLTEPTAIVLRDSEYKEALVSDLVPGDIIILTIGQRVPADARIAESYGLMADESSLTGEPVSVEKVANMLIGKEAQLYKRQNMVFAGSIITKGRGKAVITGTGMKTELGKIAGIVQEAKIEKTPLQKMMKELTKWMVWVALFFSILIPAVGILKGQPVKEMILTGLALSFATIPEELPIVATMVLALGAFSLSKRNALVKKLDAAETLGSVTVICSDKTGTLTENKMKVARVFADNELFDFDKDRKEIKHILEAASLCNDVLIKDNIFVGDPTQVAGLNAAVEAGLDIGKIKREYGKLASEFSFDSQRKMMSVVYSKGDVFVSGAPEAVLKKCSSIEVNGMSRTLTRKDNEIFIDSMNRMSKDSLRVIAFARKKAANAGINQKEAESGLALIGMIGLIDPPRKDVKEAVAECHDAGIRVIMITGDNADTAKAIARKAGIDAGMVLSGEEIDKLNDEELSDALKKASVFARVSPEHKLRIINSLKDSGEIVAVTGDGINDAPALSNAHIGIAMGETGTDVAREASSMVLTDDNFSTIAGAVREGRKIFDNMKKGIRYYLSCKVALITIFLLPVLFSLSLPFAPVQIILLELFMDIAASAGFSIEKAEADIMKRKPRDAKEKFLNKEMIKSIIIPSVCLVAAVLFSYFLSIYEGADIPKAQTMAFATWIFGHIFLAFNMRSEREPVYKLGFFSNKAIVIWAAAAIGTLIFAVNVPYLENVLRTTALSFSEWASVIIVSFIATFWMEANKILKTFK